MDWYWVDSLDFDWHQQLAVLGFAWAMVALTLQQQCLLDKKLRLSCQHVYLDVQVRVLVIQNLFSKRVGKMSLVETISTHTIVFN